MYSRSILSLFLLALLLASCAPQKPNAPVNPNSVNPGGEVTRKGSPLKLLGNPVAIGQPLPAVSLVDAATGKERSLSEFKGQVLLLSIVPSIDTKICELQTHFLGEEGDQLPADILRVTISRDTPFAQTRFAEEAKLTDLQFLSDYKEGAFGRSIGLLMEGPMLLARAVLVIDREGIVRYIQVVPEITELPDMQRAFNEAVQLAGKQ